MCRHVNVGIKNSLLKKITEKLEDRPLPTPAIQPPPGREPKREIWPLSKQHSKETKYRTSVYIHKPPAGVLTDNKKPVLYIHGIQSHPSWFFGSALALADAGHTVYQITRRGSGDNTKQRGHAQNAGVLYSDITACIHEILGRENVEKVHLVGVSWGGKLITAYSARGKEHKDKIASLSLLAPGIISKVDAPITTKIFIAASKLLTAFLFIFGVFSQFMFIGWDVLTAWVCVALFFLCYGVAALLSRIRFRIPLNAPELFTNNPAMQEYLRLDKFQLHKVTAQFMFVSKVIDIQLKLAKADSISCPTTLILASDEKIIDNDETEQRVGKLAGDFLKIIRLPGSHTLEFEPNPQPFFNAVVQAVARGEKGEENEL